MHDGYREITSYEQWLKRIFWSVFTREVLNSLNNLPRSRLSFSIFLRPLLWRLCRKHSWSSTILFSIASNCKHIILNSMNERNNTDLFSKLKSSFKSCAPSEITHTKTKSVCSQAAPVCLCHCQEMASRSIELHFPDIIARPNNKLLCCTNMLPKTKLVSSHCFFVFFNESYKIYYCPDSN